MAETVAFVQMQKKNITYARELELFSRRHFTITETGEKKVALGNELIGFCKRLERANCLVGGSDKTARLYYISSDRALRLPIFVRNRSSEGRTSSDIRAH